MTPWLLSALVAVVAVAALPLVRRRSAARKLHATLCEQSGLTPEESAWLWQRALLARLADPALVFVRPSLFEGLTDDSGRAAAVHRKLFGG